MASMISYHSFTTGEADQFRGFLSVILQRNRRSNMVFIDNNYHSGVSIVFLALQSPGNVCLFYNTYQLNKYTGKKNFFKLEISYFLTGVARTFQKEVGGGQGGRVARYKFSGS